MYGIIYLTVCLKNNKTYVGQHKCTTPEFDGYFGSGLMISKAIKKYGRENFIRTTLCVCESAEELNECEKRWIAELKPDYNISAGGSMCLDPECRKRALAGMINFYKNHPNRMKGKKRSDSAVKNAAEGCREYWKTHERSEEYKEHMREVKTGLTRSDEAKRKQSETIKQKRLDGWRNGKPLKVKCIETGEIYESCFDAARKIFGDKNVGNDATSISRVARGLRKSVRGFHFVIL